MPPVTEHCPLCSEKHGHTVLKTGQRRWAVLENIAQAQSQSSAQEGRGRHVLCERDSFQRKPQGLVRLVGGPFKFWARGKGMPPRESWGFHKPRRGCTQMSEQTGMLRRLSVTQASFQNGLYLRRHSGAVTVAPSGAPLCNCHWSPVVGWEGPWRNS